MSKENAHAMFSPSGAHRWLKCPGSIAIEQKCENKSSSYAAEGTAAHQLAEWTLKDIGHNTRAYLGRIIEVKEPDETYKITVDEDMCDHIQKFVDTVLERIEEYKLRGDVEEVILELEERVNFSHIVGKEDQFGTVDVLILVAYKDGTALLSVEDLKYGMGVPVYAEGNKQLKTYGLAAKHEYDLLYNITHINTVIHMVRWDYVSEHMYEAKELEGFASELEHGAMLVNKALDKFEIEGASESFRKLYTNPGDHCKFCNAKAKCPALADFAMREIIIKDFVDLEDIEHEVADKVEQSVNRLDDGLITLDQLGEFMEASNVIEEWLRAVRGRVEAELLQGREVPGFKLVQGKKGNRVWCSSDEAEDVMKSMRLKQDDMYKKSLISPTQAEKILKGNARRWNRLNKLITQSEGKPSVAPQSDKRPAIEIKPVVDDFEDLTDDNFDDLT